MRSLNLFGLARVYFQERLKDLEGFQGFFPRIYIPSTNMVSLTESKIIAHQTLAVIDTKQETLVGVGYNWDPLLLGAVEI